MMEIDATLSQQLRESGEKAKDGRAGDMAAFAYTALLNLDTIIAALEAQEAGK